MQADAVGLAYCRCERIVRDIALFSVQILWTNEGSLDGEQGLHHLRSNFLPNGILEIAYPPDHTKRTK